MNRRNCPNCGAPYSMDLVKCPYCGTSYFDLTAIDLVDDTPVCLKIRYMNIELSVLARPHCTGFTTKVEPTDCYGVDGLSGESLYSLNPKVDLSLGIDFEAIPDSEGRLFCLAEEKK